MDKNKHKETFLEILQKVENVNDTEKTKLIEAFDYTGCPILNYAPEYLVREATNPEMTQNKS